MLSYVTSTVPWYNCTHTLSASTKSRPLKAELWITTSVGRCSTNATQTTTSVGRCSTNATQARCVFKFTNMATDIFTFHHHQSFESLQISPHHEAWAQASFHYFQICPR
ncbi:hypothetical protein BsWGS_20774 [Bradybaena similaris]